MAVTHVLEGRDTGLFGFLSLALSTLPSDHTYPIGPAIRGCNDEDVAVCALPV